MKKTALLFGIFLSIGIFAQETAKSALLELEAHVYHKKFSKKWEKLKKADWEKSVLEAEGIEKLNVLFNEMSDLFAQSTSFSMGNAMAETEVEFVAYIMEVEGVLSDDFTKDWSDDLRKEWLGSLEEFLVLEKEKKKKEDQMLRFQKMTAMVKDFTNKFPEVWADSKKNVFENTSGLTFNGGSAVTIEKDEYGVASYIVVFDTDGDEKLAKKLAEELMLAVADNVEEGYKEGNDMDPAYTGSMKKTYQFEGEKFVETAKKPTVEIGVLKENSAVKVVIIEPVFGH